MPTVEDFIKKKKKKTSNESRQNWDLDTTIPDLPFEKQRRPGRGGDEKISAKTNLPVVPRQGHPLFVTPEYSESKVQFPGCQSTRFW